MKLADKRVLTPTGERPTFPLVNRPDELRISFDQNPAAKEYFQDKKPGDPCKLEPDSKFTVKAIDPEGVDLIVEAFIPEGYEQADDSDEHATQNLPAGSPMSNEPNMTPAAMMVRKVRPRATGT